MYSGLSHGIHAHAGATLTAGAAAGMAVGLVDPAHPQRLDAEAFVRSVFLQIYGARLDSLYPYLLAVTRGQGGFAAVAGFRPAGAATLFSECYLDRPVERYLDTAREGIAELGNLAPAGAGQARWLICALSAFLIGAGFTHVVFTLVPVLRNAFRRMGLPLMRLADADPRLLPPEQRASWGSYYRQGPALYAGDIAAAADTLLALMRADTGLQHVSGQAFRAGREFSGRDQRVRS